jgi:hypothetical protein
MWEYGEAGRLERGRTAIELSRSCDGFVASRVMQACLSLGSMMARTPSPPIFKEWGLMAELEAYRALVVWQSGW